MEKTFEIVNPEISLAAVEDAINFGLKAYLKKENDKKNLAINIFITLKNIKIKIFKLIKKYF